MHIKSRIALWAVTLLLLFAVAVAVHRYRSRPSPHLLSWPLYSGNTAYGKQSTFSINYPPTWNFLELRGSPALQLRDCVISLGVGGAGAGSWVKERSETVLGQAISGTATVYHHVTRPDIMLIFASFAGDYNFQLQSSAADATCLSDFKDILKTFRQTSG